MLFRRARTPEISNQSVVPGPGRERTAVVDPKKLSCDLNYNGCGAKISFGWSFSSSGEGGGEEERKSSVRANFQKPDARIELRGEEGKTHGLEPAKSGIHPVPPQIPARAPRILSRPLDGNF